MNATRFFLKDYNPLQGLTEATLGSMLQEGERGAYASVQWLYRFIEKRNPTARAVKRRLLSAIGKLDWDIKTADAMDDPAKQAMAEGQAATLRAAYDRVKNLHAALQHLASADLRGFAHLEKIGGATPTELRPVEQWFWCRDGLYGAWQYNAGATQGTVRGAEIVPQNFIIRELDDPAMEVIAKCHVRQEANDSDWDGYLERFGIPAVIIEGPPNVPADKEAEYQAVAEDIASDASGYIPNGAKAHTVAPGTGSSVFKERLEYLDGQIVIAGTAGKLNILTQSGSGTLAGGAQKDAFDDMAQSIAASISGLMQEQFDAAILAAAHPGEPVLAYFEFAPVDEDDAGRVLDDAVKATQAGYAMDDAELSEKSGYKLTRLGTQPQDLGTGRGGEGETKAPAITPEPPAPASPVPESPSLPVSQSPASVQAATAVQLGVTADYLAPAQAALDALIANAADGAVSNEELLATAEDFLRSLPELAAKMDATGIAAALEAAMRGAAEDALKAP